MYQSQDDIPLPEQLEEPGQLEEQLERLRQQGIRTRQDQADALGIGRSTLHRHIRAAGLGRPQYDKWIPWKVSKAHHPTAIATHLRRLAALAEGRLPSNVAKAKAAIRWAQIRVERGEDVTYDRDHGYVYIPAGQGDRWFLAPLLDAAKRALADMPQLDELGKGTE